MRLSINPETSLLSHFAELESPRVDHLVKYLLIDIVAITICAVICDAETWVEVEAYGHSKAELLTR